MIQPIIDRLISNAKKQETHNAIRSLNAFVMDKNASRKVMQVFCERYKTRTSGFTSVKAVGARKGDGAQLVDLTLIDAELGTQDRVPEVKEVKPKAAKTVKTVKKTATPAAVAKTEAAPSTK